MAGPGKNKNENKGATHDGVYLTSGALDVVTSSLLEAIGALATGKQNLKDPQKMSTAVKSDSKADPKKEGLLGLLKAIKDNTGVIIGGQKIEFFKNYLTTSKEVNDKFQKLFEGNFVDEFKETPKHIVSIKDDVNAIRKFIVDEAKETGENTYDINVSGANDFSKLLESIKSFKLDAETRESLNELAELSKDNGALGIIIHNVNELNKSNVDFESFKNTIQSMNETTAELTAIGEKNNVEAIQNATAAMEPTKNLIVSMIGIGTLLMVVGLLGKYINFEDILKFSLILLGFLVGVVGVFVLANKLLEKDSNVLKGIDSYIKLVVVSSAILMFGGIVSKIINVADLLKFTGMLLLFLVGLTAVYNRMSSSKKEIGEGIRDFTACVIASSFIMILGSALARFIDVGALFKFTGMLMVFLLALSGIFLIWNKIKGEVASGIGDAVIAVGLAAFIMFLGAATVHALDVASMLKFLFFLGTFLFGICIVMLAASKAMGDEMKGVYDAVFLVTASAFLMFLGAAVIKHVNKKDLLLFTAMLDLFLFGICKILGNFAKKVKNEKFGEVLKQATIFVTMSSAIMLLAGYLFIKYPRLKKGILKFLFVYGIFLTEIGVFINFLLGKGEMVKFGLRGLRFDPFGMPRAIGLMKAMNEFLLISTICLIGAGYVIANNPHMVWAIPAYLAMLGGFVWGIYKIISKMDRRRFGDKGSKIQYAQQLMRMIEELLLATSVSFLILAYTYKIIERAGGMVGFAGLITCVVVTVGSLLGLVYLLTTSKITKPKATNAAIAMGAITVTLIGTAFAFSILANVYKEVMQAGGMEGFTALVTKVQWTLGIMGALTIGLALALGNGATTAMAWLAISVLLGMSAAVLSVAFSFNLISRSLKTLSEIEKFDSSVLIEAVKGVISISMMLQPMIIMGPGIMAAALAMTMLSKLVSEMANAVADYAQLKIPIYAGKTVVGYRNLNKSDFKVAGENVALIVSTLSEGVMEAYKNHREWYEVTGGSASPLWCLLGPIGLIGAGIQAATSGEPPLVKVIRVSKMLAPLISQIASSVKDYADLKVKVYGETGTEVKGYRHLTNSDFQNAAKNIANVVTTLSEGIMMAYEIHPEWYGFHPTKSNWIEAFLEDGNPMSRVIKTSKELGPLISKISKSVQDYVNLKIPIYDKNKTEPVGYRSMAKGDFKSAAENIKLVLLTLGNGVMSTYTAHPDWFKGDWMGLGDSPFENVINTNVQLSELISKVASSIKDYVDLKIPVYSNDSTEIVSYKNMVPEDFKQAGANISTVLTTMGNALMKVYTDHKDWFEEGIIDDSPFQKVIDVNKDLSKLISDVSTGIKNYADLRMPDYDAGFDENGNPKAYKQMDVNDFAQAGGAISAVIVTMALGLMGYTATDPQSGSFTEGPWAKFIQDKMIDGDDDDWEKILTVSEKISKIVSSMAEGISHFADMAFPDVEQGMNENGRWNAYKKFEPNTFKKAAECITTVVTTIAEALVNVVEKDTKGIWGWEDDWEKSPLYHVISTSEKIGNIISSVAQGISEYSNLKFARYVNGKQDGYVNIEHEDFIKAGANVTAIMEVVMESLIKLYEGHEDVWKIRTREDGFLGLSTTSEDLSPIERVVDASVKMGDIISKVAGSLVKFASKKMGKNGEEELLINASVIGAAKKAITETLTAVGNTMTGLATNADTKDLFNEDNTSLEKVITSMSAMTGIVATTAKIITDYASMKIPTKFNENGNAIEWEPMSEPKFNEAKKHIKDVLTTLGDAFKEIMLGPNGDWIKDINSTFTFEPGHIFPKWNPDKISGESVSLVLSSMLIMTQILSGMTNNIYSYATMNFPISVDEEGKAVWAHIANSQLSAAKDNIVNVMTVLGDAILDTTKKDFYKELSKKGEIEKVQKLSEYVNICSTTIQNSIESIIGIVGEENIVTSLINASLQIAAINLILPTVLDGMFTILKSFFEETHTLDITLNSGKKNKSGKLSFFNLVDGNVDNFTKLETGIKSFIDAFGNTLINFAAFNVYIDSTKQYVNELYDSFIKDEYTLKIDTIITSLASLLMSFNKIVSFDEIFSNSKNNGIFDDMASSVSGWFKSGNAKAEENREYAMSQITLIQDRLEIYSNLVKIAATKLIDINSQVQMIPNVEYSIFKDSVSEFSTIIKFLQDSLSDIEEEDARKNSKVIIMYSTALNALLTTTSNMKGLQLFGVHVNQFDKFIKTVNSIKLTNLTNLNKFVTSLNQLANKMGSLDKLTDALANKLSVVLEKLVERLVDAQLTIVKADKIQSARHKLIKESVAEIKTIMEQPMTVQIQQVGGQTTDQSTQPE